MQRFAILFLFLIPVALGCDCIRTYAFFGVVTDNSLAPLACVEVRMYYGDSSGAYMSLGLTDSQGEYRTSFETLGEIEGQRLSFVKAGYQTTVAEPFNVSEAYGVGCDSIALRRDAIMQP